jgi:hypothetical protein
MGEGGDDLWQRLRQRKLVQWAVGYAAGGWVALQVAQSLAGIYRWPDASLRWLVAALLAGFAPAMALAWYHGERGRQRIGRSEVLVVGALLAVGGAVAWWARPQPAVAAAPPAMPAPAQASRSTPGVPDKSVAVLPFENLSREPENS